MTTHLNYGDSKQAVLKFMGPPMDRQVNGQKEEWQYCTPRAELGWNDYEKIQFNAGQVTGIDVYRSGVSSCQEGIRW